MKHPVAMTLLTLSSVLGISPPMGAEPPTPFLLDLQRVDPVAVSRHARNAMAAPLVCITEKAHPSPSGDPHDYVSYGRYWWPNPATSNGLPFVRRDGESNREQIALGDRAKIDQLTDVVGELALAWHLGQDTNCARRAGEWLRAWFVTPATRINPSLDYSQVRLGHNENRGSNFGIIDTRGFAGLIDSVRLLMVSPALSESDLRAIQGWFDEYLNWLLNSENGRLERETPNNHGSWYLVQAIAIARFLGDDERARQLALGDRDRIAWQFEADGHQPLEITRADGLSYSVFNLEAQFQVAALAAPLGVDLWNFAATNGASLRKGLEYLRPYNSVPQDWPHDQQSPLEPGFLQPLLDQATRVWTGQEIEPSPAPSAKSSTNASAGEPSPLAGAEVYVCREIQPEPLRLHVFKPARWTTTDQRPALVYFSGGGAGGSLERSAGWARYAAALGMVGIVPTDRTQERFGTSPLASVADGGAAVHWVQAPAQELGVNPERMFVGGSSAGGHVAWWTAIQDAPPGSDPKESPETSGRRVSDKTWAIARSDRQLALRSAIGDPLPIDVLGTPRGFF